MTLSTQERRSALRDLLHTSDASVTATHLAAHFGVSRQIIVGDIAILRAGGARIIATPQGYAMDRSHTAPQFTIACQHNDRQLKEELYQIVDLGGSILDVIVEHALYGQLVGNLQLRSRYDVDRYCQKLEQTQAQPLSMLTEGIHLHTLSCPDEATYERIVSALREIGVLYE